MISGSALPHIFYFPTQVVLVDDDPDYLDAVSLLLHRDLSYRLFQSANQALLHINQSDQHIDLTRRCYSSYKTGPQDSDTLSHVDVNEIHKEVYNPARFQAPTVVVVDYSMPEMDGLEFCAELTNPYVKKILLTGRADTDLAVQAFNDGLIDQFVSKKDQNLEFQLSKSISNLQQQYFSKTFKLISDPIVTNSQSNFFTKPAFADYFRNLLRAHGFVEYYLVDNPYSGFILVDAEGRWSLLLVMSEDKLGDHYNYCMSADAPQELKTLLKTGQVIPAFNTSVGYGRVDADLLRSWQDNYLTAERIDGDNACYCALVNEDDGWGFLEDYQLSEVYPYSRFINAPGASSQALVH